MVHLYGKFYLTADGNSYTVGIPSAVSDRRRASGRTVPLMREARYYTTLENAVQGAANAAAWECYGDFMESNLCGVSFKIES